MLIDHMAYTFVPLNTPLFILLDCIGKITGPVMFFFLVEGFYYTHNFKRYLTRMGIFAFISYVPFIYCFQGQLPNAENWMSFNIFCTLFLCLVMLKVRHSVKNPIVRWILMVFLIFLCSFCDWYYLAPIIVLIFDTFRGNYKAQAQTYCLMVILLLSGAIMMLQYLLLSDLSTQTGESIFLSFSNYIAMAGLFIPIFLLKFYHGEKGKGGKLMKWAFYWFYPVHLTILGIIHYGIPTFS